MVRSPGPYIPRKRPFQSAPQIAPLEIGQSWFRDDPGLPPHVLSLGTSVDQLAIYAGTENAAFVDTEVRAVAGQAHRAITTAIRDRDATAAGRRMRRHVHSYAGALAEYDEREAIVVGDCAVGE